MAKIRLFYISKSNEELHYMSSKYSKNELANMINESFNDFEEDIDENFEDDEFEKEVEKEQFEIPNHEVSVLILENIFDINNIPFIKDPDEEESDDEEFDDEFNDDVHDKNIKNNNYEYDVDQLTTKYLD